MGTGSPAQRWEWLMLVAAVVAIPAIVIEQSHADPSLSRVANILDWVTWLLFLGEAVVLLVRSPDRLSWVRRHPLEVAIIVVTPPFVPASLQAARIFRLLRLLRLLRFAVLTRRLLSTQGIRDAGILAFAAVLLGGAAFAAVEDGHGRHVSVWDGIWWAMSTVTTVGYGDVVPHTTAGRGIGICIMLVGIGFVAVLTAGAAERFIHGRRDDAARQEQLAAALAEISGRLDQIEHRLRDH